MRTNSIRTHVALLIALTFAATVSADALQIEISADGHARVELSCTDHVPNSSFRFNGVPYLTTSDWNNNIRRQVGAVAIGDMNNDGLNDLVVGCYISQSFPPYPEWRNLIYYNTPTGLEATPSWVSADQVHTGDIQLGYINNDPYLDIFSANGGSSFSNSVIYFGGPTGPSTSPGWTASPPQATWTTAATLFDFDHDGDLDVFTAQQGQSPNPYRPTLGFRNNNGTLETTPFWQSAQASIQGSLEFGDLDGDGWEDLAISKWVNFQTAVHKNMLGVLQTTPVWESGVTSGDRGVAWADVDDDGDLDLAVGRSPTMLYANNAGVLTPTWTSAPPFTTQPQDMKWVDVDRDGDMDLAEMQFSTGRVHIYLNTGGTLSTSPSYTYDDPVVGNAIAFGDLNGDGWPDMAVGLSGDISVRVFYARIPVIPGDMNCDGFVNGLDIDPFALAMLDPSAYATAYPFCDVLRGDFTSDSLVDTDDVDGFTDELLP